jgi:hypothetical protein
MAKERSSPKYCKEAPEWFDLGKYEAVRELDAKGWLYQLSSRLVLDTFWQPPPDDNVDQLDGSEPNRWDQTADEILDEICNNGVLRLPDHSPHEMPDPYDRYFGAASYGYSAVRSLTNLDMYWGLAHSHCQNEILEKIKSYKDPASAEFSVWLSSKDWAEQVFQDDNRTSTFIGIDLNVSDEQLVVDFRKWLRSARETLKRTTRKRNFTENDFGTWRQFRVLPYIDLQMWARKSGFKYTHEMMANFLFDPSYMVGRGTVRRTIQLHAERFLSAYPALRAQVEGSLIGS